VNWRVGDGGARVEDEDGEAVPSDIVSSKLNVDRANDARLAFVSCKLDDELDVEESRREGPESPETTPRALLTRSAFAFNGLSSASS